MTPHNTSTSRLAVIGDIHGNADALKAVLKAVKAAGIHDGIITGDLVMRGTQPEHVIKLVRATGWPVVMGNTDQKVGLSKPHPRSHPASERPGSRSWTIRRISRRDKEWLAALPGRITIDFAGFSVVLTHGHAGDLPVEIDVDTPPSDLARVCKRIKADVIVTGHTHRPVVHRYEDTIFMNPGAVGEGVDDDRRPSWGWLEVVDGVLTPHLERVTSPLAGPRLT